MATALKKYVKEDAERAPIVETDKERGETRPSQEEIALLAYECWQERGCPEGSPEIDWYRAEETLAPRRVREE